MDVKIRKRARKDGKVTLALEIYKGYIKNGDGKVKAIRETNKMEYYLFSNPKTTAEREHNKEHWRKAEALKGQLLNELINDKHGFRTSSKTRASFLEYFDKLAKERFDSQGNYGNWDSALKHLKTFADDNLSFEQIDVEFCKSFKVYLTNKAKTKSGNSLSGNTSHSYYCKFKAALNQAIEDGIINQNPSSKILAPQAVETKREFLTLDEVKSLVKAECRYEVLKRAFLFSCLTGLRWSDIITLKWSQVKTNEDPVSIVFNQKKTAGLEYLPINQQALSFMGNKEHHENVFASLKYSSYMNVALTQWMLKAGITKHITFHCARHTYATLQLTLGTDIYTVSKMLGHRELKTTQVYAKIIDEKKIAAANRIPDIL